VVGVLGACVLAKYYLAVQRITTAGAGVFHFYLSPALSVLHEQPTAFGHRFSAISRLDVLRQTLIERLGLPAVEPLDFPEQTASRDQLIAARSAIRADDFEAAYQALLDAGWSAEAARAFVESVMALETSVICLVVDNTREDAPGTSFELMAGNGALWYFRGGEQLAVGTTDADTVLAWLEQAIPLLA
jgi:hypothetical protein